MTLIALLFVFGLGILVGLLWSHASLSPGQAIIICTALGILLAAALLAWADIS